MLVSKAAHRYATAFLEIAKEQKAVESALKDMVFIKNILEDSKDLLMFLNSPIIKPLDKQEALDKIFGKHINKLTAGFIQLISEKERTPILAEIVMGFIAQYNKYAGIIEIEVRSALELSKTQVKRIKQALENSISKKVELKLKEQSDLKGGILVQINDTVIDGTVKHKLEQLEQNLLATSAELN